MVYLLYGNKDYRINEEIKKITKNIDKINITKYDLNVDEIKDVINDAETYSLFEEKKIIIIENANMFTGSTSKDSEIIEKYIENENPLTTLILIVRAEKIDSRKKITKLLQKKGKILEFNEDINIDNLIKKEFKDYKIDYQTLNLFKNRVGTNPLIIENEINKIKLYKDNNEITKEDVLNVTTKTIEIDIFKLIDDIVKSNKENAIEIYNEMLKVNEEPLKIVIMLANQFRIMYQSKELMLKGYTEKDIASLLKIHPYRVKLAIQNSRNYSSKTLLKYINDLADIDIGIKTGKLNKDLALELFILK
ncbi:MAG: DNA polymerase III subunit delta [Bacilli bacterium]|nr:DNA polymerase III subunit delta [Bacilli bacterium]